MTDKLAAILDVAWNDSVRKVAKISFKKTIDVQFGIYQEQPYSGWLTINLKPSKGWIDWLINLVALPRRLDGGWVHSGYWEEILHHWEDFRRCIIDNPELLAAMKKGVIISGRSKGAAEAVLIAYRLWYPGIRMLVGAVEPPMCCSYQLCKQIEGYIGQENIIWICYKNDIVPGIPKWFDFPGIKYQLGNRCLGLSIKDHQTATTDKEILMIWLRD